MNKEVKDQWVKALRSGEYEQGRGVLRRDNDTFCCLGVLCDLAVKAGVIDPPEEFGGNFVYGGEGDPNTAYPPAEVREWAGLAMNPIVPFSDPDWDGGEYGERAPLTAINDSGKGDFHVIADLIEEHL